MTTLWCTSGFDACLLVSSVITIFVVTLVIIAIKWQDQIDTLRREDLARKIREAERLVRNLPHAH